MVHDGAIDGPDGKLVEIPARHGVLFDPDRFPFLEGRPLAQRAGAGRHPACRCVPDGTIFRALENLLFLDGERLCYRALDVEQIGSVYETDDGLPARDGDAAARSRSSPRRSRARRSTSTSMAARGSRPTSGAKWLKDRTDRKLRPAAAVGVRKAAEDRGRPGRGASTS